MYWEKHELNSWPGEPVVRRCHLWVSQKSGGRARLPWMSIAGEDYAGQSQDVKNSFYQVPWKTLEGLSMEDRRLDTYFKRPPWLLWWGDKMEAWKACWKAILFQWRVDIVLRWRELEYVGCMTLGKVDRMCWLPLRWAMKYTQAKGWDQEWILKRKKMNPIVLGESERDSVIYWIGAG